MCNCSPFPCYPRWPLLHTLSFTRGLRPPGPPSFFLFCSVFTCNLSLNVQCLSCSGVLRPSQWIGSSFGAEVTAPPFLPFSLPPSPPPLLPQGRRPAWEMGPTCAAWWMAALLAVHVPRLPGEDGAVLPACPPRIPLVRAGTQWNYPRTLSPPSRHRRLPVLRLPGCR